ncbi:MAG: thioredoxin-dependent thiol peroxidase [Lacibacter sp.]
MATKKTAAAKSAASKKPAPAKKAAAVKKKAAAGTTTSKTTASKKSSSQSATAKKAASKTAKKAAAKTPFKNHATSLNAGMKAPAFTGVDQDGKTVSLADYKGKKLALYFYPQDDTPGCTAQACSLRDGFAALKKAGIEVLGVSADSVAKHKKFETKYQLPFRLLADENKEVIRAYDVWGPKQFMGRVFDGLIRTTFLINEKGVIEHVIHKPDTKNHAAEILQLWGA